MTNSELSHLVEQAGFIFRGRVIRQGTADAKMMAGSYGKAVVVQIEEILLSIDALRGLAGKEAIVVTERAAALEAGTTFVLFTNCVVVGDHLVVREIGHLESSPETVQQTANFVKMVHARPLERRVAEADLILTGEVIASSSAVEHRVVRSEHDPDWWIARVKIHSVLKGHEHPKAGRDAAKPGLTVDVLFANSTDIAWYQAPKLLEGMSGVLILRHLNAKEAPTEVGRPIHQALDPLDFLATERLPEVRRALEQGRGDS